MRRFLVFSVAAFMSVALLAGCDVPTPPPELPTATPGSQNPDSPLSRLGLTPVLPTPDRQFSALNVGPGHIFFVRAGLLYRVNPDGTGEQKLADLPVTNPPQPSRDGKMVAFTSNKDLYVVSSDGGGAPPRKVASGEIADDQRVGWSPDGLLLGYITLDTTTPGNEDAWSVRADGSSGPQKITTLTVGAGGRGPTYQRSVQWSPDNKWVLVGGENNPMRLLRWPLSDDPSSVRDISGGEPDWAPDSLTIVYSETLNGALAIYEVIQSDSTPYRNEAQLIGTGMSEYAQGPGPRWSPASVGADSDPIAYRSRTPAGEPRVSLRRRGARELATLPSLTNNPSWSPTGDRLVVETGKIENDPLGPKWVPTGLGIAVISQTGEHAFSSLLKDAQWPAWSR